MKKLLTATFLLASPTLLAADYSFSSQTSQVSWEGSKVVGGSHNGSLAIQSGFITIKDQKPVAGEVVVDMTTISNKDLTDPEWNKKLVDHLKSDDFFGVKKHPVAKVKIQRFEKSAPHRYKLYGDLTIKGITKPVELQADFASKDQKTSHIIAEFEFDRTDFGIRYGSQKFFDDLGDKMISDQVKVKVDLKLEKPITLVKQ